MTRPILELPATPQHIEGPHVGVRPLPEGVRPLIINPVHGYAHPSVEATLFHLAQRGWGVLRAFGALGVDRVRCHLASKALQSKHDWWVWVDSDMVLNPGDLEALVVSAIETKATVMGAAVVTRGKRELNLAPMDPSQPMLLGAKGGVYEVTKVGTALLATHRSVFADMWDTLPECDYVDDESGETFEGRPFFHPMIRNRTHYGEDFTFCLRARDAGHRVYVDTRIGVGHEAATVLTWADAQGAQRA